MVDMGVIETHQLTIVQNGAKVVTSSVVPTFSNPALPSKVKIPSAFCAYIIPMSVNFITYVQAKTPTKLFGTQTKMKDQECQNETGINYADMMITKMRFIGFITEVVNCAAQRKRRSEKLI